MYHYVPEVPTASRFFGPQIDVNDTVYQVAKAAAELWLSRHSGVYTALVNKVSLTDTTQSGVEITGRQCEVSEPVSIPPVLGMALTDRSHDGILQTPCLSPCF